MAKVPKDKPPQVQAARLQGDTNALRAMGKAGAKAAALNRRLKAEAAEEARRQSLVDAEAHAESNRIGWDDDYRP